MHIYSGFKKKPFKKTKLLSLCMEGGWHAQDTDGLLFLSLFFSSLLYASAKSLGLCNQFGAIRLPTKACQLARKSKTCLGHIPMSLPELTHASTETPQLISFCTHPPTFWSTQLCRRHTLWSHLWTQMGRLALSWSSSLSQRRCFGWSFQESPQLGLLPLADIQILSSHLSKTFLEGATGRKKEANVCSLGQTPSTQVRKTQRNSGTRLPFLPSSPFPSLSLSWHLGNREPSLKVYLQIICLL